MLTPETLILAIIGLGALGFLVRRLVRLTSSSGCGKGCGCSKKDRPGAEK